jgi:hypothetical protein
MKSVDDFVQSIFSCASEYRYDRNVRMSMQLFVLHIWPSLINVQQHDFIKDIIEKHRRLAFQERRPRFCTNSLEHRLMLRSLQCLLCLTSVIKDSVRKLILRAKYEQEEIRIPIYLEFVKSHLRLYC